MSEDMYIYIKDVMTKPVTIAKSAPITDALDKMLNEDVDPLIVTDNGSVAGIISREAIADKLGKKRNSDISPTKIHVANTVSTDYTAAYPDQGIEVLPALLQHAKIVVVFDTDHRLIGQVSYSDLLRVLQPSATLKEVTEPAFSINAEERVVHLRRRMVDEGLSRFIVTDENGSPIGIVTETDVAKSMQAFRQLVEGKYQDHRIRNLLVRDIMSAPLISINPDLSLSEIIDLMLKKKISSVAVSDGNNRVAGLVTRSSLVRAL
ncbi:CBS domain-containing protein [Methanofollis aquaemaris]|uniref:CBS domain-containing protein n=1 Tax=Methanofollis aquaemaris TaxID=126734 RepID=A0A8A3S823_9EURY|nr:CBS domain-containing protein [Methanofollis aquaemaris]QSZ67746.1 CBS domain-containing protein [Methanofollis aquaemaris]